MAVEVAKVELKTVQDASGLVERILAGQCAADQAYRRVCSSMASGPKRNAAARGRLDRERQAPW